MKKLVLIISFILCGIIVVAQEVNMDYYIHLKITPGTKVYVEVICPEPNTPIKIVDGSSDTTIYINPSKKKNNSSKNVFEIIDVCNNGNDNLINSKEETADYYIYGDVIAYRCYNHPNVKEIIVEHNPILEWLIIDVTSITSLDISKNQNLWKLQCNNNPITFLDISNNQKLKSLCLHGNKFTTDAMDKIMCDLTDRTSQGDTYYDNPEDVGCGMIELIQGTNDPNYSTFLKTNVQNALNKNWKIVDVKNNTLSIQTTGTYDCSSSIENVAEAMELNVFPNPASDILNISCNEIIKAVSLINILGQEMYYQNIDVSTAQINIANYLSGNYILKIETLENVIIKNIILH